MEGAVALVLALLAIPFVLPFISWVSSRNTRRRVDELENRIARALLDGTIRDGQNISVDAIRGDLVLTQKEPVASQ